MSLKASLYDDLHTFLKILMYYIFFVPKKPLEHLQLIAHKMAATAFMRGRIIKLFKFLRI